MALVQISDHYNLTYQLCKLSHVGYKVTSVQQRNQTIETSFNRITPIPLAILLSCISWEASWIMRNIETFPSKHLYISLVERKVAEFFHNMDRRRYSVWLNWLREGSRYQIGSFFGKISNCLWRPPPLLFWKIMLQFFVMDIFAYFKPTQCHGQCQICGKWKLTKWKFNFRNRVSNAHNWHCLHKWHCRTPA